MRYKVLVMADGKTVIHGCIYRSPSDLQACESVNQLLNEVSEMSDNVLLTGDFNLEDINWDNYTTPHSETSPEYKFIECLRDNFLFQHVNHFTRCQNERTRNILDLIITKNKNNIDNTDISPSLGCSDHVTLVFDLIWVYISTCSGKEKYLYRKCGLENDWVSVD